MFHLDRSALALAFCLAAGAALPAAAQVTFYEHDQFRGRSFSTPRAVANFTNAGFNDRASSVVVARERWEVCDDAQFRGRCVVLRPGNYANLSAMGLNDRVSSVRKISLNARLDNSRYAPPPPPPSRWQRRGNERLYEANVTSVRAVMGPAAEQGQRCWIEREPVAPQRRSENNVGGALVGAVLGGILGHQIGGGTGRDIATVGGVVAGAALGSRVGNGRDQGGATQDVQRCEATQRGRDANRSPEYWDVSYTFRGQDHRVQMRQAPGPTVTVNRQGEPRG